MFQKTAREENETQAVTRAIIYVAIAHISRQVFVLESFRMENIPSVATVFVCNYKCESYVSVGFVLARCMSVCFSL